MPLSNSQSLLFLKREKQKREKFKNLTVGPTVSLSSLLLLTVAPVRPGAMPPCRARGRRSTCSPGGQVALLDAHLLPLSLSPSPSPRFPDRARSLASSRDRRHPAAVPRASPSTPATSGQAEATTCAAASTSTSTTEARLLGGPESSYLCSPVRGRAAARRALPRQNPAAVVVPVRSEPPHASRVSSAPPWKFSCFPSPSQLCSRRAQPPPPS